MPDVATIPMSLEIFLIFLGKRTAFTESVPI